MKRSTSDTRRVTMAPAALRNNGSPNVSSDSSTAQHRPVQPRSVCAIGAQRPVPPVFLGMQDAAARPESSGHAPSASSTARDFQMVNAMIPLPSTPQSSAASTILPSPGPPEHFIGDDEDRHRGQPSQNFQQNINNENYDVNCLQQTINIAMLENPAMIAEAYQQILLAQQQAAATTM